MTPTKTSDSRLATLVERLGFNSLLGRFVYGALLLLIGLTIIALVAQQHVRSIASTSTANLAERELLKTELRDIANDLWLAETQLQQYLLDPGETLRQAVVGMMQHTHGDVRHLLLSDHMHANGLEPLMHTLLRESTTTREITERLAREIEELQTSINQLLSLRATPEQLFPGLPVMLNNMLPAANHFYSAASLAVDEARDSLNDKGQRELHQLFSDARQAHTLMVGSFRLWIANRVDAFGGSRQGKSGQSEDVELYAETIERQLKAIAGFGRRGLLGLQQEHSLTLMQLAHADWRRHYRIVQKIYTSDRWRADIPHLREQVHPLFQRAWDTLRSLEQEVDSVLRADVTETTAVADRLLDSMWLITLLVLATAILGALIFDVTIRRPLLRIGRVLLAAATGNSKLSLPDTATTETRKLIEAFRDMHGQVQARQESLQAVLTYASQAIVTIDEHGNIESFNPAAEQLFGYRANEAIGKNVSLLVAEPHGSRHDEYLRNYRQTGQPRILGQPREENGLHRDGSVIPITLHVSEMLVSGQRKFLGMIADNRERRAMIEVIRTRQEHLRAILDNTAEGIITFDIQGRIETWNRAAERLFGKSEDDALGTSIASLIAPESREHRNSYIEHYLRHEIERLVDHEGEVIGQRQDNTRFPMSLKITRLEHDGKTRFIALLADIAERKAMMEHLRHLAEHDGLTGLYNRSYFQTEFERAVERIQRSANGSAALLYLDLDNFKYVNDTLGHAAGDRLLIEIGAVLGRRMRKSDIVARLGGDEFVVLAHDAGTELAAEIADSCRRNLADFQFRFEGRDVTIGCSIGVVLLDPQTASAAEAMSRADYACHLAKRAGRNRVHLFTDSDARGVDAMALDMGWAGRIRAGIEQSRFVLAMQPVINIRSRAVAAHELLLRLRDEQGELLMPESFLPSAERFGLATEVDLWVIDHAVDLLARRQQVDTRLRFSVNLSAQTLTSTGVVRRITRKLAETGIDPSALTFEITETAAIADMNTAIEFLGALRAFGCKTALDDFGSGMSSFAYLRELPVDAVKIDGRFVKNLLTNPVDQAMVKAMNDIAHALGKETVAEYVESEEHLLLLATLGIDYGQGYYVGKPLLVEPPSPPGIAATRITG